MRWTLLVALLLLAGCVGSGSSAQVRFTGGSGDFDADLDCGDSMDLFVDIDAASGELLFAVLDGDDEPAIVYDRSGEEMEDVDVTLRGAAGNWKLAGHYGNMDGSGLIRISC